MYLGTLHLQSLSPKRLLNPVPSRLEIWTELNPGHLKHIFPINFDYKLGIFRCPADLLIPFAGTNRQDLCLDVTVTWYFYELFGICFLNSCFLLFIFHILFKYNWIIRIIFEYSNLFRDSNIFESFLKSRIIFGFGFENFLIKE